MRERMESSNPETRARRVQFRIDMQERMKARGLDPNTMRGRFRGPR